MKKIIGCLFAVITAVCLTLGLAGCTGASINPDSYAYVTIDINPSVEIITLGNNVVDVKAGNYDACVLLEGEDFSSMTIEEATEKIVSLAEQTGYLTDTNNIVKISVIADDGSTVEMIKSLAKSGAEKGSKKAVAQTGTRLQDELTVKKLKEEKPDKFKDITEEKVRLIESVMEHDPEMSYDTGADMSVNELASALKKALSEDNVLFTSELRSEYSLRYTEQKQAIERAIAQVCGEEYLSVWEEYTALENIYDNITARIENSGMEEADVQEVVMLLGITDLSLIEKGGIVKPEYVYSYIDKHIGKKPSQTEQSAVDQALKIIERYGSENYALSEDEIQSVEKVLGEEVSFTLLADLASLISEYRDGLNEIKDALNLSAEQIAQIEDLKEGFASIKDSVLEDMSDSILRAKEQISAQKQERLNG